MKKWLVWLDRTIVALYVLGFFILIPLIGFPLSQGGLEPAALAPRFWPQCQALELEKAERAGEFLILSVRADGRPQAAVFQRWAFTRRYRLQQVIEMDAPYSPELRGVYSKVGLSVSGGQARVQGPARFYGSLQMAAAAVCTVAAIARAASLAKGWKNRKA